LYAFLARRGYDSDDIRAAMDAVGEALRGVEEVGAGDEALGGDEAEE
jgi:hypothetical protein